MWKNAYEIFHIKRPQITFKSITVRNFYTRFFFLFSNLKYSA